MTLRIIDQPAGYFFYQLFWKIIDLLYPPYCSGCGCAGTRWCTDCQISIKILGQNICPICGLPQHQNKLCSDCNKTPPPFDELRSHAIFDGSLRNAIHRLKYNRDLGIAEILSKYLIDEFHHSNWQIDLITSVPIGKTRMMRQGYNHASVLARPVSIYTGIPFIPEALKRQKEGTKQVGHSISERMENVKGAFRATPMVVKDKSIMIIDDVITTSATMHACALALKQAEAKCVYGLSLARTPLKN